MRLTDNGTLTVAATHIVLTGLILGAVIGAFLCWRSLRRDERGLNLHAHADGTLHSHAAGSRHHQHPTLVERYDARLTRILGPRPGHVLNRQQLNVTDSEFRR